MNCANHPETPAAAFCQNCGKPLCSQCVRSISGVIYCENCLAAKLGIGGAAAAGSTAPAGFAAPGAPSIEPDVPNPGLAALLGFIPGVGAMYNGQFIKALIHVLVFVVLIGITDEHTIFLIFIFAWVFYQVFDAHQTAKARRDGLPLPDPFGLNELGQKLGIPNRPYTYWAGSYGGQKQGTPNYSGTGAPPAVDSTQAGYSAPPPPPPPQPPYADHGYTQVPPVPPDVPPPGPFGRRPEPVGAVVLIVVGMLFLFSTLGVFRFDWISHGWPIIVIVVGVWLLVRRMREVPPPPPGGAQ